MVSETLLVAAAFPQPKEAEAAVRDLGAAAFGDGDISVVYTDTSHMVKEGLVGGATFGGVVGGLVGLLFPPLGLLVAAGPIVGVLASAVASAGTLAVAGAAIGTLTSALVHLGMPQDMADRFGEHIHKGDALVVVHASKELAPKAEEILKVHGPRVTDTSVPATTAG